MSTKTDTFTFNPNKSGGTDVSTLSNSSNLFQSGKVFRLAAGDLSNWKIECDALTDNDWETFAFLIAERCGTFSEVFGVPTGANKLAEKLEKYKGPPGHPRLLVDDVYTTGKSINEYHLPGDKIWVCFARKKPDRNDINVLFQFIGW